MSTKPDVHDLARVDPAELDRFAKLDRETQRQIVELTRRPAKNPKVLKRDRQIAEARAKQLEQAMRKRRTR